MLLLFVAAVDRFRLSACGQHGLPDTDGGFLEVIEDHPVPRNGDHVGLQAMPSVDVNPKGKYEIHAHT